MVDRKGVAIAVFAHNEEKNIIKCLESIRLDISAEDQCFVLNNGSTDNTASVVNGFLKNNDFCNLISIQKGDKCHAWNVFCHEVRPNKSIYVFLDGDCFIKKGSVDAIASHFRQNDQINVVAGVPDIGHRKFRNRALERGGIVGNLYALSPRFISMLHSKRLKLPVGLIGDDSLLSTLTLRDLDPLRHRDESLLLQSKKVCFSYETFRFYSFADIKMYYNRKKRYSLRHFQDQLLLSRLKIYGLRSMPKCIDDLYSLEALPSLKWRGLDTWFDYLALRCIRKSLN